MNMKGTWINIDSRTRIFVPEHKNIINIKKKYEHYKRNQLTDKPLTICEANWKISRDSKAVDSQKHTSSRS